MNFRKLELEDQPWFPKAVKDGMTDYLRFLFHTFDLYHPVVPMLYAALQKCNSMRVVDLCSGSGGFIERINETFQKKNQNSSVSFVLTDIVPRIKTWQYLSQHTTNLSYAADPVDATNVPLQLKGFRTIFSGIHHFDPAGVQKILSNATKAGEGIAIFDGGDKNVWMVLLILVIHPLAVLVLTPFIAPFRWSRIFFTYLVPLIPAGAVWDGIISIRNLYNSDQLMNFAAKVDFQNYIWKWGKVRNRFGLGITFLIGIPDKV